MIGKTIVAIRYEVAADVPGIAAVHRAAFPTIAEAKLVMLLRDHGQTMISLVAEIDRQIVGHVLLSPVTAECNAEGRRGLGLAPLAVLPTHHRRGIGSQLVEQSLKEARHGGYDFAVVLGETLYYRRFGFKTASDFGLSDEYGGGEHFMVLPLHADGLGGVSGLVKYGPEFARLE